jgi:hypothetical protein
MKNHLAAVFIAFVCGLLSAPTMGQQEFASESKSWAFTMPEGWQPMTAEQVAKLNKQYKVRDPNHPSRVVAGFIKSGGLFAYPQVVLQVLEADMSKLSWPALQRMCKDGEDESPGAETAELIAGLIDSSGADPDLGMQFNQGAAQVSSKGGLVLDDQVSVKTSCRTFLHTGGAIQLTGLDYLTSSGGEQRALDAFAGSFHVSSGHNFVGVADVPPKHRQSSSYSGSSGGHYYYGGGGAAIIVVGIIARSLLRSWARGN